jgi:SAM-dependent methyltransferase
MRILLRAAFHLYRLREAGPAAIAIDAATGISAATMTEVLRPWRAWLEITDIAVAAEPPGESWIAAAAGHGAQAVVIVSEQEPFIAAVEATAHGLRAVRCDYATDSDREDAFFKEMAHHHFEIGGLNEWDGSPVQYSAHVLQHLSAANCVTHFPRYMTDELRAGRAARGAPLEALDVGSGSISRLRWGALEGLLHVTGVDPLQDVYDLVLAHHGFDGLPAIAVARRIAANGEDLDRHVAAGSFDFAYCHNALDHVEDPPAVISQVARALRPGGAFALEFATREGSRQQWHQLHQFDLYLRDVPLALDRVVAASEEFTVVVLRRTERAGGVLRALRRSAAANP